MNKNNRQIWKSQYVKNLALKLEQCVSFNQHVAYIIEVFLDYRMNYSGDEFNPSINLNEEELFERDELFDFLEMHFYEIQCDVNNLPGKDLFNNESSKLLADFYNVSKN